tara:strand:- start:424 stop:1065 length:642 start_codon:yes stop_codon:yes gene_type:complete
MDDNVTKELKYFESTPKFYQFVLLTKIADLGTVELPLESDDREFLNALSFVSFLNLIDDHLVERYTSEDKTFLRLTEEGNIKLHKHRIDYQLDLIKLENLLGSFFLDLIIKLKEEKISKIALYGASDTSRSVYKYLINNNIKVLCILDDDEIKHGQMIFETAVVSPTDIHKYPVDAIIISTIQYQEKLFKKAKDIFEKKMKIVTLFNLNKIQH